MTANPFGIETDSRTGFTIVGRGALGGKAQGLGLACDLLKKGNGLSGRYPQVEIRVPDTLIIAGDAFEIFVRENGLDDLARAEVADAEVAARFLDGRLPGQMEEALRRHLETTRYPLAVRSSGLLEDLHNHAYAGLYRTYMLSNDQSDLDQRFERLVEAVKLVYASTFYQGPRAYARRVGDRLESGVMAVMIQQVAGVRHDDFHYPAIAGVAQSLNHYPLGRMKAEDGLATIALGLGKQVVSGERALRFCPKYPKRMLQRNTVEEVLAYAQRRFYALQMGTRISLRGDGHDHLVRRRVSEALEEPPVRMLSGTYVLAEHRIRDNIQAAGQRVLTFAGVLKYDLFPLAAIVRDLLELGRQALGEVEIEFAVDPAFDKTETHRFYLLQMRSMAARQAGIPVEVNPGEAERAMCFSRNTMGNGLRQDVRDIVYVKPGAFDPGHTRHIARRVAEINAELDNRQRQYLLVGPGRWGSADPWLGIPVRWADISNVAAIVETTVEDLKAEPSQGAHFFHNISSLGISYFSVAQKEPDFFDWTWLTEQTVAMENEYIAHVRLDRPMTIKVDVRSSRGVILIEDQSTGADK